MTVGHIRELAAYASVADRLGEPGDGAVGGRTRGDTETHVARLTN